MHKISLKLSFAIAFILIIMGSYSVVQAVAGRDVANAVFKIKEGKFVSTDRLRKLAEQQNIVVKLSGDGLLLQDLGLIKITLAKRYGYFSRTGKKYLQAASLHTKNGLAKSPAHSVGWLRLAYINMLLEGSTRDVSKAIYMSIVTSPYNYRMIYYRLNLAIIAWKHCTPEERDAVLQQIRIGWSWDKKRILEFVKSDNAKSIVRSALYGSYEDLAEFDRVSGM